MSDYWTDRAVPILKALETPTDPQLAQSKILSLGHGGAEALGVDLTDDVVYDTILHLADAGYLSWDELSRSGGRSAHFLGLRITGRGLQVLGQWPRFELLISPLTFAALLDALADYAPEDEAKSIRHAADIVRSVAATAFRSLILGAGGQLARNALGLP
jgi:hypothetical protein